jgi:hypothetical protein
VRLPVSSGPLFDFVRVDARDAASRAGALQAMFRKELDGVILRGALDPGMVAGALDALTTRPFPEQVIGYTAELPEPSYTVGNTLIATAAARADVRGRRALRRSHL